eukprot:5370585-Pyramimonas_sp.AAC.1
MSFALLLELLEERPLRLLDIRLGRDIHDVVEGAIISLPRKTRARLDGPLGRGLLGGGAQELPASSG